MKTASEGRRNPGLAARALALCALTLGAGAVIVDPGAGTLGQYVFVPVDRIDAPAPADGPVIEIRSCAPSGRGLRVEGWVGTGQGDDVRIAVTWPSATGAGRAVGVGYATASGLVQGGAVGSFVIHLPGASVDATFAVSGPVERGTLGSVARPEGPIARCP